MAMIHFDSPAVQYLFIALAAVGAAVLLFVGYRLGRWMGTIGAARLIASKEQELFTAQKGFKTVYEHEQNALKKENTALMEKVRHLEAKVEDYRKKAAGFGGLFGQGQNESSDVALCWKNDRSKKAASAKRQAPPGAHRFAQGTNALDGLSPRAHEPAAQR
jgi:hypothetical protein